MQCFNGLEWKFLQESCGNSFDHKILDRKVSATEVTNGFIV